jgi:heme-degrading monooxygenase HmoA
MSALDRLLAPCEPVPVTIVNRFTLGAGKMDAFVALQRAALQRFTEQGLPGLKGSRLYQGMDGRTVTLVSVFSSMEAYAQWRDSGVLAAHRIAISPLIERAEPGLFQLSYEAGQISPGLTAFNGASAARCRPPTPS